MSNLKVLRTENDKMRSEIDALQLQSVKNSSMELNVLQDSLMEKEEEIRLLEDKRSNMLQEIGNIKHLLLEVDEKRDEVNILRNVFKLLEEHMINLQSEINFLVYINDTLQKELETTRNYKYVERQFDGNTWHKKVLKLESQLEEGTLIIFQAKETQVQLETQVNELKEQLKTYEGKQVIRLKQLVQLVKEFQTELSDKVDEETEEVNILSNVFRQLEEQIANLQSEINSLIDINDTLQKGLGTTRNRGDTEYQFDGITWHKKNKKLEAQLDELITFQSKEIQMQLKTQVNELREQLKTYEEKQVTKLKQLVQLVKEFQAELHDKEEELQAALEKRFDGQHNYESDLVQQNKEQLRDFQIELTEKSEEMESLFINFNVS